MEFGRTIRNFGGEFVWSGTYLMIVLVEEDFSVVMNEMAF